MNKKFNKILIIGISESALDSVYWEKIKESAENIVNLAKDSPDIMKEVSGTDCLLIGFGIVIDEKIINNANSLKYIGVLATAYGKVDVDYASAKGIIVCNIPGYSTESVAEFVFAIILDQIRETERGKKLAKAGDYSGDGVSASEIKDKIFGVIGLGRIGSRVAEIALGFGANVRYWSRDRKQELEDKGIIYEDADELIPKCDFLSLHLAQVGDTENFLNETRVMKIKKGAVVVNTAPMELVDINAISKRLQVGDITFILDHSDEMSPDDIKLLSKFDNCIIYPPIAYISNEARIAKQEIFVNNITSYLAGASVNQVKMF